MGGLEGSDPEACITGVDLRVIHTEGAEADAVVAQAAPGVQRHGRAWRRRAMEEAGEMVWEGVLTASERGGAHIL